MALIGAFAIIGAAWWTRGAEHNDTWLYVFSVWMILFSAIEIVKVPKVSRPALALLIGAFAIILVTWWANGAEHVWVFLTCVVSMLVAFFAILSQKKQDNV